MDESDATDGTATARPRRIRRYLAVASTAVVAIVVLVAVVNAVLLWRRPERVPVALPGSAAGGSTVLLVGTDSRADDVGPNDDRRYGSEADNPGERADVMLAVRRDADGSVRMLELPRDLLVVGSKGAPVRLTTTLLDGPSGLTKSLCRSLGLGVDHIVEVRFPGLRSIINTVGGVDVVTERPLRDTYTKFQLPAGRHRLNGDDALAYVAARHVEIQQPDGSWKADAASVGNRSSKGAQVLRRLGTSAQEFATRPVEAQQLAWRAAGAVTVDSSLSPTDLRWLVSAFRRIPATPSLRLPVVTQPGFVPLAVLQPSGGAVIAEFEGARRKHPPCVARLPAARRP